MSEKAEVRRLVPDLRDQARFPRPRFTSLLFKILKSDFNKFNSNFSNFLSDVLSNESIKHVSNTNVWNYSTKQYESQTKSVAYSSRNSMHMMTGPDLKTHFSVSKLERRSDDTLPERVFVKRNSLLTDMFKLADIRTIRHVFITILIILMIQVYTSDTLGKQKYVQIVSGRMGSLANTPVTQALTTS
jgi:hypothetical protein